MDSQVSGTSTMLIYFDKNSLNLQRYDFLQKISTAIPNSSNAFFTAIHRSGSTLFALDQNKTFKRLNLINLGTGFKVQDEAKVNEIGAIGSWRLDMYCKEPLKASAVQDLLYYADMDQANGKKVWVLDGRELTSFQKVTSVQTDVPGKLKPLHAFF